MMLWEEERAKSYFILEVQQQHPLKKLIPLQVSQKNQQYPQHQLQLLLVNQRFLLLKRK